MFNKFFDRLFNGSNERDIKKMRQLVEEKINPQESALKKLSDSSLANKTNEFKARLAKGETLDDILPDAFAVIREASRRVLGMRQLSALLFCTGATLQKWVREKARLSSLRHRYI